MKKKHMDFLLEDNPDERILFRFYPRTSHMHSFHDAPPASFRDVYKVYYSWGILYYKQDDGTLGNGEHVFFINYDECSALEYLSSVIRNVLRRRKRNTFLQSFGMPSSEWSIFFIPSRNTSSRKGNDVLVFHVFDNSNNKGYRFVLDTDKAREFCMYLDDVNRHMLENGEPV